MLTIIVFPANPRIITTGLRGDRCWVPLRKLQSVVMDSGSRASLRLDEEAVFASSHQTIYSIIGFNRRRSQPVGAALRGFREPEAELALTCRKVFRISPRNDRAQPAHSPPDPIIFIRHSPWTSAGSANGSSKVTFSFLRTEMAGVGRPLSLGGEQIRLTVEEPSSVSERINANLVEQV